MNALRRIAIGIGGTLVVALLISLVAPKTVQAVVSALVTVANTPSNPVPTQAVDNPAQHPFQAQGICTTAPDGSCRTGQFSKVPSAMTAVVQYFSGDCMVGYNIAPSSVFLTGTNGDGTQGGMIEITVTGPPPLARTSIFTFGGPATLYAASTSGSQAAFSLQSTLPPSSSCEVFISGYYVNNGE